MALGNVGSGYMNWFYAAWLPGYLETGRHLTVPQTGWAASIPYLFGVIGSLAGGFACDRLAAAGLSPILSRKLPIVCGLTVGGAFTGLAILAPSTTGAIAAISAALFFSNLAGAAIWAMAITASPARRCGLGRRVPELRRLPRRRARAHRHRFQRGGHPLVRRRPGNDRPGGARRGAALPWSACVARSRLETSP